MTRHAREKPDTAHRLKMEDGYLTMSLSADICCQDFEGWPPEDHWIRCTIHFNPLEGRQSMVGKVRARLIDREQAYKSGWKDEEIFDEDGANWRIYEEVYLGEPRIPKRFRTGLLVPNGESNANILVIDTVDILPKYRGLNFSLVALRSLIHHFRLKVGLIVLLLLPRQILRPDLVIDEESQTRLQRHFGRLGFIALPETDFMIADPVPDLPAVAALRQPRDTTS